MALWSRAPDLALLAAQVAQGVPEAQGALALGEPVRQLRALQALRDRHAAVIEQARQRGYGPRPARRVPDARFEVVVAAVVSEDERAAADILMHQLQHSPESFRDDQPLPGGMPSPTQQRQSPAQPHVVHPTGATLPLAFRSPLAATKRCIHEPSIWHLISAPPCAERPPSFSERPPSFSERPPSQQGIEYRRADSYRPDEYEVSEQQYNEPPYDVRRQPSYRQQSPQVGAFQSSLNQSNIPG